MLSGDEIIFGSLELAATEEVLWGGQFDLEPAEGLRSVTILLLFSVSNLSFSCQIPSFFAESGAQHPIFPLKP